MNIPFLLERELRSKEFREEVIRGLNDIKGFSICEKVVDLRQPMHFLSAIKLRLIEEDIRQVDIKEWETSPEVLATLRGIFS